MGIFDAPSMNFVMRKFGYSIPQTVSLRQFIDELDAIGVDRVVYSGRSNAYFRLPNDHIADVVGQFPERIIGFAGIDPSDTRAALRELRRCHETLKLTGVSMDHATLSWMVDDARLYPVYSECEERSLPVVLTLGPLAQATGYMEYGSPLGIDRVATDFPDLKILCAHGSWPWLLEMIAIAHRHDNVYFDASAWIRMPGHEMLVSAVNSGIVADKLLYGSALPFNPMREALRDFLSMGWDASVIDQLLYRNAAIFLGLETNGGG